MSSPTWLIDLIKFFFPFRSSIARLTRIPPLGSVAAHTLFRGDAMIYLPKEPVVVHERVGGEGSMVLPSEVVDHFIEQASHLWLMNFCLCRTADHCQDYPHELGCLFLGPAVLQINPALGHLVSKEEAHAHIRRCREAGLVQLIGRDRIDSIWMGVHPSRQLMTICNCCPCCCLFRILPDLSPVISQKITRMPGVQVRVGEECIGCGKCTRGVCFVQAITLQNGRAVISDECRGCGRCVEVCPHSAIHLSLPQNGSIQQTLEQIGSLVKLK